MSTAATSGATGGDGGNDGGRATGINASTSDGNSAIDIVNSGGIWAAGGDGVGDDGGKATGIAAFTENGNSAIDINNSGGIWAAAGDGTYGGFVRGIDARTENGNSPISIVNSGGIEATGGDGGADGGGARGIYAATFGGYSRIDIVNSGDIRAAGGDGGTEGGYARGIYAVTTGSNSRIDIVNSGDIEAAGGDGVGDDGGNATGIYAITIGVNNSPIDIVNSGDVTATGGDGSVSSVGIRARAVNSSVRIENASSVFAEGPGNAFVASIDAYSATGTTIINSGTISASSQRAINVDGEGTASIFNTGTITGFVDLTDQDDRFINQNGGVFEARLTSDFGPGSDLFRNENGGTVHALRVGGADPSFVNLERFENRGLISTVDGFVGDNFTISNTVGDTDLDFVASGNSRLAVDAFLGAAGSTSDTFTIDGNVSGTTAVTINNVNGGAGVFNPTGIRVVTVTGATPNPGAFFLDQPFDTGFFDYDLFFTPTGSGFWEFRSFAGAGAFLLPQLVTAAQDIWHQSSSTWFDRTADLRVLLAGGTAPAANSGIYGAAAAANDGLTPAVWVRGSGSWLDRDDAVKTTAYGRNYTFDLDRELDTIDFQVGVDMGTRDFLSPGDILIFGLLGGFIHADLDYDNINRNFDYDGGQVGVYATYLKGGLFVDTLLNVHLYELETSTLGFPSDLNATTLGLRTDTGYRFGSFAGGVFFEPLATLEVIWADIDGFSVGGNTVSFDDDANVRGRLGLRAGTTMQAWDGTMMEPFVVGSVWGNLSGDNQATLVSSGSTFRFEDQLDDVWGEVSAGVNFFNPSATTAVFAKVDVTFGEDVSGVGGKAGMRVRW